MHSKKARRLAACASFFGLSLGLTARAGGASAPSTPSTPSAPSTPGVPGETSAPKPKKPKAAQKSEKKDPQPVQPYVHEGFVYRSTTAVRYNPLGLSTFFRVGYQRPLLGPQDNILLQRTYIGLHAVTTITPAFIRGGLRADIQPLAFLQFLFSYEAMGLFGTFDTLQSFQRVSDDFSDTRQVERGKEGLAYSTTGAMFTADIILQAKLGPMLLISDTQFVHTDFTITPGDRLYYDLPFGLLTMDDGWMVSNETDLSYATSFGLLVGVRHGLYHSFLDEKAIAGVEARARAITPIEYMGPLVGWQFPEHNGPKRFNAPGIFLNVSIWLRNPYRTGQEIPQTVPYIVSGFTFKGTL